MCWLSFREGAGLGYHFGTREVKALQEKAEAKSRGWQLLARAEKRISVIFGALQIISAEVEREGPLPVLVFREEVLTPALVVCEDFKRAFAVRFGENDRPPAVGRHQRKADLKGAVLKLSDFREAREEARELLAQLRGRRQGLCVVGVHSPG